MANENTKSEQDTQFNYDCLKVADIAWGAIKRAVMREDYESQAWFVSIYIILTHLLFRETFKVVTKIRLEHTEKHRSNKEIMGHS